MEDQKDLNLCTVVMDGAQHNAEDFVAILSKENGDASIYYNTDALTLGMAMKMVAKEFTRCMLECTVEERKQITDILGDAFMCDKEDQTDVQNN